MVAGDSDLKSARRWVGAAVGGFVGLNAAALAAAVEFGIQPALFHAADGTALYCPYPLSVAVPAMMVGHLVLAGPAEGLVTALVVRYLQATDAALLAAPAVASGAAAAPQPAGRGYRRLWWGLGALVVLTPLGLLAQGTAWGEWGAEELRELAGYVPAGFSKLSETWTHVLLPDYALPAIGEGFWRSSVVYIVSAVIGVGLVALLMYALGRVQAAEQKGRGRWRPPSLPCLHGWRTIRRRRACGVRFGGAGAAAPWRGPCMTSPMPSRTRSSPSTWRASRGSSRAWTRG